MGNKEQNSDASFESNRITNIILNHWNDIKGRRKFPSEHDLDLTLLEPLLDNCFLIKAEGVEHGKYNYKFLGKNIMNAYGSDLTKRLNSSDSNPLTQKDKILEVLKDKYPISDEGEFKNKNGDTVKYRQCLVPLSNDGFNIDSIFGGMRLVIVAKDS